jgi:hypothetical protein
MANLTKRHSPRPLYAPQIPTVRDINDHAARIKDSAVRAAAAILERRAVMDRTGREDQVLAVAAGEIHYAPAHHIHHMAVLDALSRETKVAFGYECRHNIVPEGFSELRNENPTEAALAHLRERDRDGGLSLKTCLTYAENYADQARFALLRFVLNRRIPARFTDVAMIDGQTLDAGDPSTAGAMQSCLRRVPADLGVTAANGMYVRNRHMAETGIGYAQDIGANILLQQCGVSHVIGDPHYGYQARHSLSAQFKAAGAAVIAMPVLGGIFTKASIPRDHGLYKNERLILGNLPAIRAIYDFPGQPLPGEPAELQNHREEAAYVNAVLKRLGFESETIIAEVEEAQRRSYLQTIAHILKECPNPSPADTLAPAPVF